VDPISFTVPGQPVAKARPRISTRGGMVRTFTPAKTVGFEGRVAFAAQEAMRGRNLIEGPVSLSVTVLLPIAQSWSGKKKLAAQSGNLRPCSRPDLDNYVKAVCDGCNMVVWKDDSQVVNLTASKAYGPPSVQVVVLPISSEMAAAA
jgi:Holliday junction resolvase RusA-like endonuclease